MEWRSEKGRGKKPVKDTSSSTFSVWATGM